MFPPLKNVIFQTFLKHTFFLSKALGCHRQVFREHAGEWAAGDILEGGDRGRKVVVGMILGRSSTLFKEVGVSLSNPELTNMAHLESGIAPGFCFLRLKLCTD